MKTYCVPEPNSDCWVVNYKDSYPNQYHCLECSLSGKCWTCHTNVDMFSHIGEHRRAGHIVPSSVFEELSNEIGMDAQKKSDAEFRNLLKRLTDSQVLIPQFKLNRINDGNKNKN
jgi:hypothetical protein